jgi:predicted amidohydrolase
MSVVNISVLQSACTLGRPDLQLEHLRIVFAETERSTDLLICPELFMTGYNIPDRLPGLAEPLGGPFMSKVAALCAEHHLAIVYGYPEKVDRGIANSAVCLGKDGAIVANHRKLHRAPGFEAATFIAGEKLTFFEIGDVRAAILICYDVEFPESVRAAALGGAELIVVPTSLRAEYSHVATAMIPMRAFENGVFVAYANSVGGQDDWITNGLSCIVDPHGHDLARAGTGVEVLKARIDTTEVGSARAAIPYLRDRRVDYELLR